MNEMLQYAVEYVILVAAFSVAKRPLRKHVEHLQAQVVRLNGGQDAWDVRCSRCHRRIKDSDCLKSVATYTDGTPGRIVRAWHSDNPKCAAAAATDKDVMEIFMGGEK